MEIEKPIIEDFDEINVIAKEVHDLHVEFRPDIFKQAEKPISQDYFNSLLANNQLYVAKENNRIVGYIIINPKESDGFTEDFYIKCKTIIVEALGVKKEYKSKGIGTQLMKFVIDYVKRNGYTDIELTVSSENTDAIKFYEKLGMRPKNIKYQMRVKK